MESDPSPFPKQERAQKTQIVLIRNDWNDWNVLNAWNSYSLTNFVTDRVEPPSGVFCPQTWIYCDWEPSPPATTTIISSGVSVTGITLSRVSFKSGRRFTRWFNVSSG